MKHLTTYGAACAFCCAITLSPTSRAAGSGIDEFGSYSSRARGTDVQSAQIMAVEIRVGRYVPSIDQEFENHTPYEDMFGSKNRYSIGLEVDWQALRIPFLGTLGPGIGIEYTRMTADSFNPVTGERTAEKTALLIVPVYAVAVLRADYLARETPVPLVPYIKAGVGAGFWRISNGGGTASVNGVVGRGTSYGPQFALGGMFLLDSLDAGSAKALDAEVGINNSYIFAEWYVSQLNGFGGGGQMNVGTNTWVLGLAFEM